MLDMGPSGVFAVDESDGVTPIAPQVNPLVRDLESHTHNSLVELRAHIQKGRGAHE